MLIRLTLFKFNRKLNKNKEKASNIPFSRQLYSIRIENVFAPKILLPPSKNQENCPVHLIVMLYIMRRDTKASVSGVCK